jgi:hypothetical protein
MHRPGKGVDASDTNPEHEPGPEKVVMVRHQVEPVVRTRRRDHDLPSHARRRRSTNDPSDARPGQPDRRSAAVFIGGHENPVFLGMKTERLGCAAHLLVRVRCRRTISAGAPGLTLEVTSHLATK